MSTAPTSSPLTLPISKTQQLLSPSHSRQSSDDIGYQFTDGEEDLEQDIQHSSTDRDVKMRDVSRNQDTNLSNNQNNQQQQQNHTHSSINPFHSSSSSNLASSSTIQPESNSNSPRRRRRINLFSDIDPTFKQTIQQLSNNETDIKKLMIQIAKDDTLSQSEKSKRNQYLLTLKHEQRRTQQATQYVNENNAKKDTLSYSNVIDPKTSKPLLGCEHYPRNCRIQAACCGMWVVCRFCHDNTGVDHTINRFETKRVKCMFCGEEQDIDKKCIKCNTQFAKYYCEKCKFFDNTPDKEIYHCDKCSICRVGNGFGRGTYHCDECDACVSEDHKTNHQCLSNSLDANCPICMQYLFTSTKPVVFMRCGHTMHSHCFDVYITENYRCPLCHKALANMNPYYAMLDQAIQKNSNPTKESTKMAEVLCHDCEKRSETMYHNRHRRCMVPGCGSYNTRIIRTFQREDGASSSQADASRTIDDDHNDSGQSGSASNP